MGTKIDLPDERRVSIREHRDGIRMMNSGPNRESRIGLIHN